MIKVLVADDNKGFCTMVEKYIGRDDTLDLIGAVHDGTQVMHAIQSKQPDVLLLDLVMPNRDGMEVLEDLSRFSGKRPKVIVMSAFGQDDMVTRATELGIHYYLMKPFSLATLIKRIHQVTAADQQSDHGLNDRMKLCYEKVSQYFNRIGIPPHYKGYRYLTEAIVMVCMDSDWLNGVTKNLYPEVGRRFSTTGGQVERAIRHALEMTWERGNSQAIVELFPFPADPERGKPTNSSFIAKMADIINLDLQNVSERRSNSSVMRGTGHGR